MSHILQVLRTGLIDIPITALIDDGVLYFLRPSLVLRGHEVTPLVCDNMLTLHLLAHSMRCLSLLRAIELASDGSRHVSQSHRLADQKGPFCCGEV